MSDRRRVRSVGAHSLYLEPPDLLCITIVGPVSEADATAMFDIMDDLSEGLSHFYSLTNLTRAGSMSAAARNIVRERAPTVRIRATAVFGASFHVRVFATLVAKAAVALTKDFDPPIAFFETEAEARAWIDACRSGRLGRGGPRA